MKLKILFSTILASALVFVGCAPESIDSFDNIKLDKTYLSIPVEGDSETLTINSTVDWAFVESSIAEWLTIDNVSGKAGKTVVTITAQATDAGREAELEIKAGNNSQFVRVRQGSMLAEMATCAEIVAGPDGKNFKAKGICTSITNDYYGNWLLADDTDEITIYGTVNADGEYDWDSFGIEVGDSVYVEGPKVTYNDIVELKDVSVIKVIKTLLKLVSESYIAETEGETFDVKLAYKGKGVFYSVPEEYKEWVSVENMAYKPGTPSKLVPNPADTAIVTISVLRNGGPTREAAVEFTSSDGEGTSVGLYTFAQAGLAPISDVLKSGAGDAAMVAGQVMAKHQSGFIVADETAAIYIYNSDAEVEVGNNVVLAGTFDNYYGTLQVKDITIKSNDNATETPSYPLAVNLERQADYDAFPTYSRTSPVDYPIIKIRGELSSSVNSKNQTEYYVTVGESAKKTLLYKTTVDYSALVGKTVSVVAYVMGYHSSGGYYQAIEIAAPVEVTDELPALEIAKIKDVVAGDAKYTVEGVVVAAGSQAYVVADATGNLMVYGKNHGRKVMEKVRLSGTASHYSGHDTNTLQLSANSVDLLLTNATWTYEPTVLDGAAMDALIGEPSFATEVQFVGTVVKSGTYLNINVEGASAQATFKYVDTALYEQYVDKTLVIKGYVMGTYQRLSVLPYSVSEVVAE